MNIAMQLDYVMRIIWDDDWDDRANDIPAIKALSSYVKTHNRRNHENVFEVIDILWPRNVRSIKQRSDGNGTGKDQLGMGPTDIGFDSLIDVQFDDDSQILVACRNGIGHGIEFVG